MKGMSGSLSLLSRGIVELSWRYAWALLLTFLSTGLYFPLYGATCILAFSAILNLASIKKGWRMSQVILLNGAGFMVCALLSCTIFNIQPIPFGTLSGCIAWFRILKASWNGSFCC